MSDDTTTTTTPLTPAAASEASESTRAAAEWLRLLITDFRRHNSFSGRAIVRYATTALAAVEHAADWPRLQAAINRELSQLRSDFNEACRRAEAAEQRASELERERAEALAVLAPAMPESGLVDAARQRMQAWMSERDCAVRLERELAATRRRGGWPMRDAHIDQALTTTPPAPAASEPYDKNFARSFHAAVWARAFMEINRETHGRVAADEETMLGWFANAIMRGYDEANARAAVSEPATATQRLLAAARAWGAAARNQDGSQQARDVQARAHAALMECALAASEPATATPAGGGGEATASGEGRSEK